MNKHIHNKHSSNRGFTLLEVLVAMLIIAVGVLGITALQFKSLQYNHDAYLRSQINFLAYDIADRMRMNRTNVADYVGNYTADTVVDNTCNHTSGANAAIDLACWRNDVDRVLPPGSTANIAANGNLYTVSLAWTDRENSTHTVNYTFQP